MGEEVKVSNLKYKQLSLVDEKLSLDFVTLRMGAKDSGRKKEFSLFIVGQFLLWREPETCRNTKKSREDCVLTLISLAGTYNPGSLFLNQMIWGDVSTFLQPKKKGGGRIKGPWAGDLLTQRSPPSTGAAGTTTLLWHLCKRKGGSTEPTQGSPLPGLTAEMRETQPGPSRQSLVLQLEPDFEHWSSSARFLSNNANLQRFTVNHSFMRNLTSTILFNTQNNPVKMIEQEQ